MSAVVCNKCQLFSFCMIQLAQPFTVLCLVVVASWNVSHAPYEWSDADLLCRHQPFDSVSLFSNTPLPLFAVFVWCYFSRKRQTPLSSGSALLQRAIHACCGVHRVKSNKGRLLFTSGTNHPDGTSINPTPCQQWLECTYVWPWTIQMRQRQIEWGCTEAIFSLARWPFACSLLLSSPHLLLTLCQLLGKCLNFWAISGWTTTEDNLPILTYLLEKPFIGWRRLFPFLAPWKFLIKGISSTHSYSPTDFLISFGWKMTRFRLTVWSHCITSPHTEACFCSCLI